MSRFKRFLLVGIIVFVGCMFLMDGEVWVSGILAGFFALLSLPFDTKEEKRQKAAEKKAKEEARRREEEAQERARNASPCYSMSNVDLMTFKSSNNIFTAGNNAISMKIRNRNPYDVIVSVRYKYSDGWESSTHSFEVGGNKIRQIDTLGDAWHKAKDVTIAYVH